MADGGGRGEKFEKIFYSLLLLCERGAQTQQVLDHQ
jgi:hypothetical protein